MRAAVFGLATLGFTIFSALMFIIIGIVFFFVNVWIIKVAAGFAGFKALDGNWVVLSAGILSAASIIAASLKQN